MLNRSRWTIGVAVVVAALTAVVYLTRWKDPLPGATPRGHGGVGQPVAV